MKRLAFFAAVSGAACGSGELSLERVGGGATGADYSNVLEAWTRRIEIAPVSSGFENVLAGEATYRSWPFREAYARRYAEDHELSSPRRDELVARERAAHEAAHEFFFSGYSSDRRSLALDTEESAWRVSLVTDGGVEAEPTGIEHIARPTASMRSYYPYAARTRMTYVIRFPRDVAGRPVLPPETKWFALRFDGPLGHASMKWELE